MDEFKKLQSRRECRRTKWSGAQVEHGCIAERTEGLKVIFATLKLQEQNMAIGVCFLQTVTSKRANKAGGTIKYSYVNSSRKKRAIFEVKPAANKIAVLSQDRDIRTILPPKPARTSP